MGICGQMGRAISEAAANQSGLYSVVAGVDRAAAGNSPVPVYASCDDVEEPFDVLVDFSVPAALPDTLRLAQKRRVPIIVGTTGLTERHLRLLEGARQASTGLSDREHVPRREPANGAHPPRKSHARQRV